MAGRIRSLKPEWIENQGLGELSDAARVLSVGLILLADDHGNGRGAVHYLAGQVWGYSRDPRESLEKVRESLRELVGRGYVALYRVDGQDYFHLPGWLSHQKVDKPGKPRVPTPVPEKIREGLAKVRESLATDHYHYPDLDLDLDRMSSPPPAGDSPPRPERAVKAKREATGDHAEFIAAFDALYAEANSGAKPTWGPKAGAQVKRLLSAHGLEECRRRAENMFRAPPEWPPPPHDLGTLAQHFDRFAKPHKRAGGYFQITGNEVYRDGEVEI